MKLNLANHITGKIKRIHKYWFITDYDLNKYKSKYFNDRGISIFYLFNSIQMGEALI